MGMFDDLIDPAPAEVQSRPPIEEPSQFERLLAKITIPESVNWGLNRARGFAMGAADPSVGAFQLGANAIGQGEGVNQSIANKEQSYEADRRGVGSEGFVFARIDIKRDEEFMSCHSATRREFYSATADHHALHAAHGGKAAACRYAASGRQRVRPPPGFGAFFA